MDENKIINAEDAVIGDVGKQSPLPESGYPDRAAALTIAGFWRRLFAFILDNAILAVFGAAIGIVFARQFNQLGVWARLFGFIIVLLYFGILNSSIGRGQTLGKRLSGIRVVDGNAIYISLNASLLRALILFAPTYLGLIVFAFSPGFEFIGLIIEAILSWLGTAIVYLIIFNRKTRQSIHDLLLNTFVVTAKYVEGENQISPRAISKLHFVVLGIIAAVTFIMPIILQNSITQNLDINMERLLEIQQSVYKEPKANTVSVVEGVNDINGNQTRYLRIDLYWYGKDEEYDDLAGKLAKTALEIYPEAKDKDTILVSINGGYDIGIFRYNRMYTYNAMPQEWIDGY